MNIEELKKQRDELDAQIKALEEDKPPFEDGDVYWCACDESADWLTWRDDSADRAIYNAGIAFATKEEAEAHIARRAATVRVNRAIERLNKAQGWVADWKDDRQCKCHIKYWHRNKCLRFNTSVRCWTPSIFLPMSRETAEAIIKSHEADILCAMGVVK